MSIGVEPETKTKVFTAEIRIATPGSVPMQLRGRQLHSSETDAFQELVAKVKRLPSLLHTFEVVVGHEVYADASKAADAVWEHRPRCPD